MTVFNGTAGDDTIKGSAGDDDFHLEQGGDDVAQGKGGADTFYMGGAFTGADRLDGGGGQNTLVLDGDYSAGVAFTATSITNIRAVRLIGGHSYDLSGLSDAKISTTRLTIDARLLGAGDSLSLDASTVASSGVNVIGGQGADTVTGGAGSDIVDSGGGRNLIDGAGGDDFIQLSGKADKARGGEGDDTFNVMEINASTPKDRIDGGAGLDNVNLGFDTTASDQHATLVLRGATLNSIEKLYLQGHLDVTMADGNVAAGQILAVDARGAQEIRFDGSLETDGGFFIEGGKFGPNTLIGGAGHDVLIGGTEADVLAGGAGDDVISGRAGSDTITGGLGRDLLSGWSQDGEADTFVYLSLADSTVAAPDRIDVLVDSRDLIDLSAIDADTTSAGNNSFNIVDHFTGSAGQLVVSYDASGNLTNVEADVDGDGEADMLIQLTGDHSSFTGFFL